MEGGDNILDAIYEEENFDDVDEDVDMIDVEEGELVEPNSQNVMGQSSTEMANPESLSKNRKRRANKKKNKRKRKSSGSNAIDRRAGLTVLGFFLCVGYGKFHVVIGIDASVKKNGNVHAILLFNYLKPNLIVAIRVAPGPTDIRVPLFVLDACRRLKERKSYMVYTAVGCLGLSALKDLINEVDAVQACGGQKTADGRRLRTGGGILWNIVKIREPNAYREILKKAKEFEKQFRQPNVKPLSDEKQEVTSKGVAFSFADASQDNVSENALLAPQMKNQHEPSTSEGKRASVHDRLRKPVSYDDELLERTAKNDTS